jgi:hypothetical protein
MKSKNLLLYQVSKLMSSCISLDESVSREIDSSSLRLDNTFISLLLLNQVSKLMCLDENVSHEIQLSPT